MRIGSSSALIALAAAVLLASCAGDDEPTENTNPPVVPPPPPSGNVVVVEMRNIAFNAPGGGDAVTISLGDEVRWVNQDAEQHTATSTNVPSGGASFDSNLLMQGQSFVFLPNVRGTWTYLCEVHPSLMVGATITVQ